MKKKNLLIIIIIGGFIFFASFVPLIIFAQDKKLPVLQPPDLKVSIPAMETLKNVQCSGGSCYIPWLAQYISGIQKYALGIIGIIAVIVLMIGGILWLTAAGNQSQIGQAKKMIASSLVGVFLLFGSYLILSLINQNMVNLKGINLEYIDRTSMDEIEYTEEEIKLADRLLEQQSGNGNLNNRAGGLGQNLLEENNRKIGRGLCADIENPDRICTEFIVIHTTVNHLTAKEQDIEMRNRSDDPYKCIAYNRMVQRDSTVVDGRADEGSGGHTLCYNDRAVGIVYSGCSIPSSPKGQYVKLERAAYFDTENQSWASKPEEDKRIILKPQLVALFNEIKRVQEKYNIGIENVLGHHETGKIKDCPCISMDDVRLVLVANDKLGWDFERALFALPTLRNYLGSTSNKGFVRNINKSWPRLVGERPTRCCFPKNDPPLALERNMGCIQGPVVNNCW